MTFLLVASSTSKGGTMVPPARGSIFSVPLESFSTRSATHFRLSKIVRLAGQLAWILRTTGAWAVACLPGPEPTVIKARARTMTRRIGVETLGLMAHTSLAGYGVVGRGEGVISSRCSDGRIRIFPQDYKSFPPLVLSYA